MRRQRAVTTVSDLSASRPHARIRFRQQDRRWTCAPPAVRRSTRTATSSTRTTRRNPAAADPSQRPGFKPDASNSPVVHTGKVTARRHGGRRRCPTLPAGGYLITVRALGPQALGAARHAARREPDPDRALVRQRPRRHAGRPRLRGRPVGRTPHPTSRSSAGIAGFDVILEDTVGQVTVDINGDSALRRPVPDRRRRQRHDPRTSRPASTRCPRSRLTVRAGSRPRPSRASSPSRRSCTRAPTGADPRRSRSSRPPAPRTGSASCKEKAFEPAAGHRHDHRHRAHMGGMAARASCRSPPDRSPIPTSRCPTSAATTSRSTRAAAAPTGRSRSPTCPPGSYQLADLGLRPRLDHPPRHRQRRPGRDGRPRRRRRLALVRAGLRIGLQRQRQRRRHRRRRRAPARRGRASAAWTSVSAGGTAASSRARSPQPAATTSSAKSLFGPLAKFGVLEVGFGRFARTGISLGVRRQAARRRRRRAAGRPAHTVRAQLLHRLRQASLRGRRERRHLRHRRVRDHAQRDRCPPAGGRELRARYRRA